MLQHYNNAKKLYKDFYPAKTKVSRSHIQVQENFLVTWQMQTDCFFDFREAYKKGCTPKKMHQDDVVPDMFPFIWRSRSSWNLIFISMPLIAFDISSLTLTFASSKL